MLVALFISFAGALVIALMLLYFLIKSRTSSQRNWAIFGLVFIAFPLYHYTVRLLTHYGTIQ